MMVGSLAMAMLALVPGSGPTAGLMWDGQPVHPGRIRELATDLADSHPILAAVDLEGCRGRNKYSASPEDDGGVLQLQDPAEGQGYFEYKYLGVLSSGVHVIQVGVSGGGSGYFQDLLFVRIRESWVLVDGHSRKRYILELVGSEVLGDRAEIAVTLKGDVVRIQRREFRGADGLGPEQTIERVVK